MSLLDGLVTTVVRFAGSIVGRIGGANGGELQVGGNLTATAQPDGGVLIDGPPAPPPPDVNPTPNTPVIRDGGGGARATNFATASPGGTHASSIGVLRLRGADDPIIAYRHAGTNVPILSHPADGTAVYLGSAVAPAPLTMIVAAPGGFAGHYFQADSTLGLRLSSSLPILFDAPSVVFPALAPIVAPFGAGWNVGADPAANDLQAVASDGTRVTVAQQQQNGAASITGAAPTALYAFALATGFDVLHDVTIRARFVNGPNAGQSVIARLAWFILNPGGTPAISVAPPTIPNADGRTFALDESGGALSLILGGSLSLTYAANLVTVNVAGTADTIDWSWSFAPMQPLAE